MPGKLPRNDQKIKCVHNPVFVLPHCAEVHIFQNDPQTHTAFGLC